MDKVQRCIYINQELWLKFKILAAEEGTTISNLIEEHIKQVLIEKGKIKKEEPVLWKNVLIVKIYSFVNFMTPG